MFYAGGVFIFAGNMEGMADTKGLDAQVETLTLGPERRTLQGVLFFDLENTASSPARIDMAFDDVATRRTLHTAVPLTTK